MGPIHGMGVSRKFLETFNLYFPDIQYGGEDMVFRMICKALSSNGQLFPKETYYYHVDRPDSNFLHRNAPFKLLKHEKNISEHMSTAIWEANFIKYLKTLNISKTYI